MSELRATAALTLLATIAASATWAVLPQREQPHPATPSTHREEGYVGSGACRSCHPAEHDSWSQTFHRTMTRPAKDLDWRGKGGPRLPTSLELYGRKFELRLEEDTGTRRVHYQGPDLHHVGGLIPSVARETNASASWKAKKCEELFAIAKEVRRELVLVTGSHHYLAFWIEGGDDQELRQFPFVYLLDEARWLPRKDAFLQPPDAIPHVARWNANCIQCHAVAGRPGQTEGRDGSTGEFWESYDTSVAEEGISCEACHGPGAKHADLYRNPLRRQQARESGTSSHIFVPSPEAGALASEACGQCHSYFLPERPTQWWSTGFSESFAAGQALGDSRKILRANSGKSDPDSLSRDLSTIFWDDGSIIVGGREYNGLSESPCFKHGEDERKLACTSCHSMHQSDPDQQISPELSGNRMCTQCHGNISAEHSRHDRDSPGAACTSCHMPRTSYALLHGIPSHQIGSPSQAFEGPPHACSLCHVDRDRAWIIAELGKMGGETSDDVTDSTVPVAIERALSGNAAERAIYAYALGTDDALRTSGPEVANLILPYLKDDPYAAVRLIAERAERHVRAWTKEGNRGQAVAQSYRSPSSKELSKLVANRDNSPVVISE